MHCAILRVLLFMIYRNSVLADQIRWTPDEAADAADIARTFLRSEYELLRLARVETTSVGDLESFLKKSADLPLTANQRADLKKLRAPDRGTIWGSGAARQRGGCGRDSCYHRQDRRSPLRLYQQPAGCDRRSRGHDAAARDRSLTYHCCTHHDSAAAVG